MRLPALLAASLLPAAGTAAPAAEAARHPHGLKTAKAVAASDAGADAGCAAVHIFLSRGSGESYPGWIADLARTICSGRASCDTENIMYPATRADYCVSAGTGAKNGQAQLVAYGKACPGAKLVILGWSEGAAVAGDILGGGGGYNPKDKCTQATTPALARGSSPGSQVAAVVLFGDVRYVAGQSYNAGSAASGNGGVWPRADGELSSLNQYAGVMRSVCYTNDPACDSGNDYNVHSSYEKNDGANAVAFVNSKLG